MARVTIEDCLDNVDNRFQLILTAAKRARQINLGAEPLVPLENDKPTVLALREISNGMITRDILKQAPKQALAEDLMDELVFEQDVDMPIMGVPQIGVPQANGPDAQGAEINIGTQ